MWLDEKVLQRARELRANQTPAEAVLWHCLRQRRLAGLKFRRQHPFGKYFLDFFCLQANLAVELDGASHEARPGYDAKRQAEIESEGVKVLRFDNRDLERLERVLGVIAREALARLPRPSAAGRHRAATSPGGPGARGSP